MPFIQVLLLLGLLAYLLLVALENPNFIHLPLPFGRGEWLISTGTAMSLFLLVGGLYAALLLLPILLATSMKRRADINQQHALEQRLAATLQARLAAAPAERPAPVEATGLQTVSPVQVNE